MRKLFATLLSAAALLPITACSQRTGDGCCGSCEKNETSRSNAPAGTGARRGQPTRTAEGAYTCPMHPEVTRSSPGKCPKCGMDLVEKN